MKEIQRYRPDSHGDLLTADKYGDWCRWSDFEALQNELQTVRAHLFAALQLIDENATLGELREIAKEARELLMGRDKKIIANLQDSLRIAQEHIRSMHHPRIPGVNSVFGVKVGVAPRYALMITQAHKAPNGGLDIEVQLP